MADEFAEISGARVEGLDLSRTRLHGAVFVDTKVTDAWVQSLEVSGDIRSLVVNGVEIADYVRAELEARHPELSLLRATDATGVRRAWEAIRTIDATTLDRARRLPPELLDVSVDGEFSFLQTLRHLVFATDRWVTGPVLGEADHFHRLGWPHDGSPPAERVALDLEARPSLDDVLDVRAERFGSVDRLVEEATDATLARVVDSPNGGTTTVGDCIRVVMVEEWWHHRYADRDLAILASRADDA